MILTEPRNTELLISKRIRKKSTLGRACGTEYGIFSRSFQPKFTGIIFCHFMPRCLPPVQVWGAYRTITRTRSLIFALGDVSHGHDGLEIHFC